MDMKPPKHKLEMGAWPQENCVNYWNTGSNNDNTSCFFVFLKKIFVGNREERRKEKKINWEQFVFDCSGW